MKKLFTLALVISITLSSFAQSPEKMSYQCVVRNASGILVANQSVGIKISILQGTPSGTVIYSETYSPNPQTNANGLVTIEIGGGFPVTGTFSAINWASGLYFLKTETDPTGGTSYTITGTSQLLSVPYALHAKTAATANYNDLSNLPALNISNWNTSYSWGNHAGLYRTISYVPSWNDITGKPTTIAGYGITNAMSTSHPANGISSGNITNWNTAYGWGNHAGLYRPIGYVPTWSDITGKPTTLSGYGVTNPVNITILNVSCHTLASVSSTWTNLNNIGSFTKLNSTSPIELTYNGRIAVTGSIGGTSVRFELRIDGVASTAGYARASIKKSEAGGNGIPVSITGIFNGLSTGTHTVSIWVYDQYGTSTDIMVDPGCFSTDVVIIKEFR
jgi:hypothetical protein